MKTVNSSIIILIVLALSSCSQSAYYLPDPTSIYTSPFGAEITLTQNDDREDQGELIAIDDSIIIILEHSMVTDSRSIYCVPVKNMKKFTLHYARSPRYGWTIPVYSLAAIATGAFAIITLPINLIVTISVTAAGNHAYRYNSRNVSLDYIRMFARFPQGIPPNINLSDISAPTMKAKAE
ncbi:hypothetical protein BH11BAC2_BH11BAC2_26080 [soil metagenome]